MNKEEYFSKRFSQTEIRGAKYRASHDHKKQYLDTALAPVEVGLNDKSVLKEYVKKSSRHFLSKIMSDDNVDKVLKGRCLPRIFNSLGI